MFCLVNCSRVSSSLPSIPSLLILLKPIYQRRHMIKTIDLSTQKISSPLSFSHPIPFLPISHLPDTAVLLCIKMTKFGKRHLREESPASTPFSKNSSSSISNLPLEILPVMSTLNVLNVDISISC